VLLNRFLRLSILSLTVFILAPAAAHCAQEAGPSKAAQDAGMPYMRALGAAATAYMQSDFTTALKKLDDADQIAPNLPDTWSMRGAIYGSEKDYDKAQHAFENAARLNPGDFWPPYNLAELLLVEKKYAQAADAFSKLEVYSGHEELVQFKVVFADLLAGKPDAAKPVLDAMKMPSDTPAAYYAQSAWAFAHQDTKQGMYWSNAGLKAFNLQKCLPFYDALATQQWLPMRNKDGSVPGVGSEDNSVSFTGKMNNDTGGSLDSTTPSLQLGSSPAPAMTP
jgi:tetratricopeptide (TPR) repeat protein